MKSLKRLRLSRETLRSFDAPRSGCHDSNGDLCTQLLTGCRQPPPLTDFTG
jgi:hypothetical protein